MNTIDRLMIAKETATPDQKPTIKKELNKQIRLHRARHRVQKEMLQLMERLEQIDVELAISN